MVAERAAGRRESLPGVALARRNDRRSALSCAGSTAADRGVHPPRRVRRRRQVRSRPPVTLSELLAKKKFKVQRFARAACPARGTLLASENIDQFLSVLTYLVGLIPVLKASPLYEIVKRVTLETVQRRWEPGMLPGIEAMIPTSPLVAPAERRQRRDADGARRHCRRHPGGQLAEAVRHVHLGSCDLRQSRQRPRRQHRLDVPRPGAQGSPLRLRPGLRRLPFQLLQERAHARTRRRSGSPPRTSTRSATSARSRKALVEPKPMKRGGDSRSATARPALVLVPDLMGSDLHAGATRIWLNYAALSERRIREARESRRRGEDEVRSQRTLPGSSRTVSPRRTR